MSITNGSGLTISHGCFNGSFASFDTLRCVWADMAGYGIVQWHGGVMPNIAFDRFTPEDFAGEWPNGAPDDPLIIVLAHDESEGRIKWQHAPYLADRLDGIAEHMMKFGNMMAWTLLTQQFSRGLRTAASYRQDVTFE